MWWIERGSRHSGADAGSYTDASQPSWIRRPITVQVIAFVIDQLGVARSVAPNSLYRSHRMRSGVAIRMPYAPAERAKKPSSAGNFVGRGGRRLDDIAERLGVSGLRSLTGDRLRIEAQVRLRA